MIDKLSRKAVGFIAEFHSNFKKTVINAVSEFKRILVIHSLKLKRMFYRLSVPVLATGAPEKIKSKLSSAGKFISTVSSVVFVAISAAGFLAASYASAVIIPCRSFYRRHYSERFGRIAAYIRRGKINRFAAASFAALITLTVISVANFNVALEVKVNGKPVGYVTSENEVEQVISDIETHSSKVLGKPFHLNADISYSLGITERNAMLDVKNLKDVLSENIDAIATLAVVSVDGNIVGGVASATDAQNILDGITAKYIGNDASAKASFLQSVSIQMQEAPAEIAMTADELKTALTDPKSAEITYSVQQGETLSEIANSFGMRTSELMSLNPDIVPEKLKIGTQLCVKGETQLLSVQVVKDVKYSEKIPYNTVQKKNENLAKNKKRVVQEGKNGSASVAAQVVLVNGVEQSRTIKSRTVMNESTDEIVEIGTKQVGVGTGTFIRPFGGHISSNYGYRGGGEFHTGVDFAGPIGSSVAAADGGKVVFSGWNGNYGYCVIISHGNGLQTLYAHNSRLVVSVGDLVEKGQVIAKVGSTGRSTGPHCHFEVRVGGRHVNPWNYLRKK